MSFSFYRPRLPLPYGFDVYLEIVNQLCLTFDSGYIQLGEKSYDLFLRILQVAMHPGRSSLSDIPEIVPGDAVVTSPTTPSTYYYGYYPVYPVYSISQNGNMYNVYHTWPATSLPKKKTRYLLLFRPLFYTNTFFPDLVIV